MSQIKTKHLWGSGPIPVLAKRLSAHHKGRNFVSVLAIVLTTLMFTALFVLSRSMSRNLEEMAFRRTEIRWADDIYAEHSFAKPSAGTMPKAADEIALDTFILDRLGIPHETGQTVTLEWRKDLTDDKVVSSSFRLCGYWEGNQSLYASMAWANLGRNKKRTVTVICSLTLGLVLLSCFYVKNTSFDMEKYLSELTISDFELSDTSDEDYIRGYNPKGDTLSEDFVSKMESLEGIEKTGRLYTHQLTWKMDEGTAENLRRFTQSDVFQIVERYTPDVAQAMKEAVKSRKTDVVMYGISGIPLETIVQDGFIYAGTYHAEAFETGRYVLAVCPAAEQEIFEDGTPFPTASVGDTITIEGKTYTVMAVVYPIEPIEEGALETGAGTGFELGFILPEDTFRELWPDNTLRKLFIDAADEQIASVQNVLDESADDTSRKKEFAMMQSIGMTRRQLRMMLIFEGLNYAGLTLALSYIISAAALEAVVKPMIEGGYTTFRFTLMPLAACTPVLLVFAVLIPYVCFRNIERKSIVERLHEAEL